MPKSKLKKQKIQKGGVYPKIDNNATLNNKKAAVLIIGAGPVGLYLAYKFLISNVFSDMTKLQCGDYNNSFECANELVIRIVEARENLDKQFLSDFNVDNFSNNKFPNWWQLMYQGDTRGFANFKEAYEKNPRLRYFASRKQVFFINREILTTWDPWLRRLVSQISCGTTTTPNRWGVLKCILRGNGNDGTLFSPGMEFPPIPDPYYPDYTHALVDERQLGCSRIPNGGISIEVGQLQIILLLAIKTRLAQMRGQLPGSDNVYPYSSPININFDPYHARCMNDVTCHNNIVKNVVIDFAPAMAKRGRIQEEEILKQCKAGIYDMVFNCSGRTIGVPYKEGSVCVSNQNNIYEYNAEVIGPTKDKVDPLQSGLVTPNKDIPLSQPNPRYAHPFKRAIPISDNIITTMKMCKQYGSVMVINLYSDTDTGTLAFAQFAYQHERLNKDCKNVEVTYTKGNGSNPTDFTTGPISLIDPNQKLPHIVAPSIADLMFQTDNEYGREKMPPCAGDSNTNIGLPDGYSKGYEQNDARFFPSRDDGSGRGRIYLGLTITYEEAEAIRKAVDSNGQKKYFKNGGLATNLKLSALSEDPSLWPKSSDDTKNYDMIIDGIIMKYMFYAASVGISPYTVNWNTAEFSYFPLTLRRVEKDNAAILQPWDNSYRFNANIRDIASSDQNPIEAHLPSNAIYSKTSIYPRNQTNFPQYPQVDQNTLQFYNGGSTCFVQVGDAAYSAHYFTGSGVNNGFKSVNKIFDIFHYAPPPSQNINSNPGVYWDYRIKTFVRDYNYYINAESESYMTRVRKEYASREESPEMLGINVPINTLQKYKELLVILDGVILPQLNVSIQQRKLIGRDKTHEFSWGRQSSFMNQHINRDIFLTSMLRYWKNPTPSGTRIGLYMWTLKEIEKGTFDNDKNFQAWLRKQEVWYHDKRDIQNQGYQGEAFLATGHPINPKYGQATFNSGGKNKRKKTRKRRKRRSSTRKRKRVKKIKTINKKNRKKNTKRKKKEIKK